MPNPNIVREGNSDKESIEGNTFIVSVNQKTSRAFICVDPTTGYEMDARTASTDHIVMRLTESNFEKVLGLLTDFLLPKKIQDEVGT
ncbi:hypothetical protein JX266_002874 [Neoarthrinium moseri]|nr:hypothetical protein JX266_002874 [Neoarthrinium moseri]